MVSLLVVEEEEVVVVFQMGCSLECSSNAVADASRTLASIDMVCTSARDKSRTATGARTPDDDEEEEEEEERRRLLANASSQKGCNNESTSATSPTMVLIMLLSCNVKTWIS